IGSDQGIKYVYAVNDKSQVETRRVTTGALQDDGLRAIATGLKADEWVVVGGLQQVRPHLTVQTEKIPMPTLAPHREAEPSQASPSGAAPEQPASEGHTTPSSQSSPASKPAAHR